MAQRDYVGRGRPTATQRKKNTPRRKASKSNPGVSKIIVVAAAAAVVIFAGSLMFLAHHEKEARKENIPHKTVNSGLPPKPEERWKYIKELENRQVVVPTPVAPDANGQVKSPTQLTDEQRQLLAQMAEDMRQQPTQLSEVPWNQQTPEQQQQTLRQQQQKIDLQKRYQHKQQLFAAQQSQSSYTQAPSRTTSANTRPVAVERPQTQPNDETQQRYQSDRQQLENRLTQRQQPAVASPPAQPSVPVSEKKTSEARTATNSAPGKQWMIQCGSFKGTDQAESTRAKLAFEGFESRVTSSGGWNRVVIGPYAQRPKVNSIVAQLKNSGHTNCITLTVGG